MKIKTNSYHRGFTLIEILLVVAIVGILFAAAIPMYRSFQVRNDLDITTSQTIQSLHRAQILAQAMDGDSTWGVKIQSGSVVLFQGSDYATRNTTHDEIFNIPVNITLSGISEIVFSKSDGAPSPTGIITLTTDTNNIRTITINGKGMLEY